MTLASRAHSLEKAGSRPKAAPRVQVAPASSKVSLASKTSLNASSKFRLVVLGLLGLFLFCTILTKSLSSYLEDDAPEAALGFNSHNATALLNMADAKLAADGGFKTLDPVLSPPWNSGPGSSFAKGDVTAEPAAPVEPEPIAAHKQTKLSPAELGKIQSLAEAAIREDPLNARAFRILGQVSEVTSDEDRTEALMKTAARRSQLESVAVYWMMRKSYQDKDYKEALRYADILLRTRPQTLPYVIPLLGKIAEDPFGAGDLKLLLANNPPWRPQFLSYFPQAITDARTPLDILLSLRDSANPPTGQDLKPYLNFLIQHGFFDLAYYTWLQFLPPERLAQAGHLFNGGFDRPPSGTPFDWTLTKGTGVAAQVGASGDKPGERGLSLQFGPGRVDYHDISELIILSSGGYKFHGRYKGDLVSERPLEWRVVCAGKDQNVIGRGLVTRGGSTTQWKDLDFSFTVPVANCPAQYVKLVFDARSASEKFISGSISFDDFQITREETTDASGPTPETSTSAEPSASEPSAPQGTEQSTVAPAAGEPAPETGTSAVNPKTSTPAAPQSAGQPPVAPAASEAAPAAGGTTPETGISIMPPPTGKIDVKPQIYDPSMAPINPPKPAPQAQPPQ